LCRFVFFLVRGLLIPSPCLSPFLLLVFLSFLCPQCYEAQLQRPGFFQSCSRAAVAPVLCSPVCPFTPPNCSHLADGPTECLTDFFSIFPFRWAISCLPIFSPSLATSPPNRFHRFGLRQNTNSSICSLLVDARFRTVLVCQFKFSWNPFLLVSPLIFFHTLFSCAYGILALLRR